MGSIVLITGGGRSGKSSYAQRLAEGLPGPRTYIATATPFDPELQERVAKHRGSRRPEYWSSTLEEPLALAGAIGEAAESPTILVDCLTMWIGNLMWAKDGNSQPAAAPTEESAAAPTEESIAAACAEIVAASREREGTVVLVTNEVGLGIIPDNPAARLYRDLLGRCNQVIAAGADTVILMVSGLPLTLKGPDQLEPPRAPGGERPTPPGGAAPGGPEREPGGPTP